MEIIKKNFFGLVVLFSCLAAVSAQTVEAIKVNEFENTGCENYISRIRYFFGQLKNYPNANGYVFVYTGRLKDSVYDKNGKFWRDEFTLPRKGAAKEVIDLFKTQVEFTNFTSDKIIFIEAGFREKFTVESWIVPDKAVPPKPTPTAEKIKQRKARHLPKGLCGDL